MNQSTTARTSSSSMSRTAEEYLNSIAGRYSILQDSHTISGTNTSRKFNSYIYQRKILLRKSIPDNETHHMIFCTHCSRGKWKVF